MGIRIPPVLTILVLVTLGSVSRADKPADVLGAHHLKATDSCYVLTDEADVLDGMKTLRQNKKQVDSDNRQRKQYATKINTAKASIAADEKEYDGLKDRLTLVTNPAAHNRLVLRMNQLVLKSKQAASDQKEAEDKENELSVEPETKFVDGLMALQAKADTVTEKYATLAADPTVKTVIDRSTPKLALGPSKEFADAVAELKKWGEETESEAIPLIEDMGVQMVAVLLNGEQHKLVLDPGSSMVTLPGELAAALKIVTTDKDPIVQLKLADGNTIQGHRSSLKSIRVGRFTVQDVPCVILAVGLHDAPALLGNSFLSHFVVKIDQKAGQLHLVEVAGGEPTTSTSKSEVKATGTDKIDAGKTEPKEGSK